MYGFEWETPSVEEQVRRCRETYRQYGLAIFESFEEYCQDKIDDDEH